LLIPLIFALMADPAPPTLAAIAAATAAERAAVGPAIRTYTNADLPQSEPRSIAPSRVEAPMTFPLLDAEIAWRLEIARQERDVALLEAERRAGDTWSPSPVYVAGGFVSDFRGRHDRGVRGRAFRPTLASPVFPQPGRFGAPLPQELESTRRRGHTREHLRGRPTAAPGAGSGPSAATRRR
jgi:hypothetical protein